MFQAKIVERFASIKSLYISLEHLVLLLALKCVKRLLIGGINYSDHISAKHTHGGIKCKALSR